MRAGWRTSPGPAFRGGLCLRSASRWFPFDRLRDRGSKGVRELIGDGNYGGLYQRPDADTDRLWAVAVAGDARAPGG